MQSSWALRAGVAAIACILQASDAAACGVAYPQGTFARFSAERTLIVWDAEHRTEHFVRALSLRGDPGDFGVFVPTPSVPAIAREDEALIDRVAELVAPPPPPPAAGAGAPTAAAAPREVKVLQRAQLGDYEAVTLAASDASALGDWLAKNHFVDKPALRQWEKGYLDEHWLITAVRCTVKGAGDRTLEVPTLRLSFRIDAPFFPYTEVPPDAADEAAFRSRYNAGATPYSAYSYGSRSFELYFVATTPMQAMIGASTGGPMVADAVRVSGAALAGALGDTKPWGFDPEGQPRWVITRLTDNVWQRAAASDVTFATYDLPKPRVGAGLADDGSVLATSARALGRASVGPAANKRRAGALLLILLIAAAAGFAVFSEPQKKRR